MIRPSPRSVLRSPLNSDDARAAGAARLAALLSASSLLGIVPHVIEDSVVGEPQRFGLSFQQGFALFGAFVTLQIVCAILTLEGRRPAAFGAVVVAAIWVVAAIADHPGAFSLGEFRSGFFSKLLVWLLVVLQLATGAAAARAFVLLGRVARGRDTAGS